MEAVWPGSIVEENNLAQAISKLRHVLGEKPGEHQFIVTVPGRGYRFVADVKELHTLLGKSSFNGPSENAVPPVRPQLIEETVATTSAAVLANTPKRSRLPLITISLLAAVATVVGVVGYFSHFRGPTDHESRAVGDKSIAVLPFESLSSDHQDSYFAAAVQEEILTNLAQSSELKVISRTSSNAFPAGSQRNGRDIARLLGVAYLLEGSVQRAGDRIRVHAQLIDARSDSHVWAQTYDRQLSDVFAIQSDIANAIAQQLQTRITPAVGSLAVGKPTQNPQAYLFYLRARHADEIETDSPTVIQLFDQAIAADPTFALARARLSIFLTRVVRDKADNTLQAKAKSEAEEALRLNPALGESHLAMAYWYFNCAHDNQRALGEVARAGQLLPNSVDVSLLTAYICKAQGRFRDRIAALHRAQELDPVSEQPYTSLVFTFRWLREWQQAMEATDDLAALGTRRLQFVSSWGRANDEFRLNGNIETLKRAVAEDAQHGSVIPRELLSFENYQIAMLERDFARAKQFLDEVPAADFTDKLVAVAGHLKETHEVFFAVASNVNGGTKADVFSRAEKAIQGAPAVHGRIDPAVDASLLHALAGRKDDARDELQALIAKSPQNDSVVETNAKLSALAAVYAQVGEPDKAVELIERLLTAPSEIQPGFIYNITLTDLKWCWIWDPLRNNPRFQKLVSESEPQTVY